MAVIFTPAPETSLYNYNTDKLIGVFEKVARARTEAAESLQAGDEWKQTYIDPFKLEQTLTWLHAQKAGGHDIIQTSAAITYSNIVPTEINHASLMAMIEDGRAKGISVAPA